LTLNPLHWGTAPFAILIIACVLLRILIPPTTHRVVHLVREALIVLPAALFYFGVRGFVHADPDIAFAHAHRVAHFEQRVGLFHELWLQHHLLRSDAIITAFNWIYIWGHWPVLILGLIWLADFHRPRYPLYRNAFLLSGIIGMTIFLTFPVAPPRLLADFGFVDTVSDRSHSYRVLQPPGLANLYAAMPSLHFGWNLLMGIAIWRETRHRAGKVFALLMPLAMFMAIVLTANHFIIDGLVGGTLVITSLVAVSLLMPRLQQRRVARAAARWAAPSADTVAAATGVVLGRYRRPLLVAHRFANEPHLLDRATRAGADLIEADVWLYRGRLEVRHWKTMGPLPLRWDRWYIERAGPPALLLEQLLDTLGDEQDLLLDVKGRDPAIAAMLVDLLRRRRPGRPIVVSSQNWRLLDRFRPYDEVRLVHSIGYRWQLWLAWRRLRTDAHDAISIQFRLLTPDVVARLQRRVGTIITWPVNGIVRLEQVTEWGVDGITSDSAELLSYAADMRDCPADQSDSVTKIESRSTLPTPRVM